MAAVTAPETTVLHRIEGQGYIDLLVRGEASAAYLRGWQRKQPCQVYRSFWEGLYVVRVPLG